MKVLVTGGAGFIGANLIRRLAAESAVSEVVVIDDLSTGRRENLIPGVDFIEASILAEDALTSAADGVDAIVHLAALGSVPRSVADPEATHDANATGTLRVLQAARRAGNAHVVLASSSSVYGANDVIPKGEALQCLPMSPYAVSKLAAEQYAVAFGRCYGLPVLPFRFFNVFGPMQHADHAYAAVIPVLLNAALRGLPLPVDGDGEQSRDFTYVGTVVETLTQALVNRVTCSPVNLAFGSRTTINELVSLIEETLDVEVEITRRATRPGDVKHSQADNHLLRSLFESLTPVSLEEGLLRTADWMRAVI